MATQTLSQTFARASTITDAGLASIQKKYEQDYLKFGLRVRAIRRIQDQDESKLPYTLITTKIPGHPRWRVDREERSKTRKQGQQNPASEEKPMEGPNTWVAPMTDGYAAVCHGNSSNKFSQVRRALPTLETSATMKQTEAVIDQLLMPYFAPNASTAMLNDQRVIDETLAEAQETARGIIDTASLRERRKVFHAQVRRRLDERRKEVKADPESQTNTIAHHNGLEILPHRSLKDHASKDKFEDWSAKEMNDLVATVFRQKLAEARAFRKRFGNPGEEFKISSPTDKQYLATMRERGNLGCLNCAVKGMECSLPFNTGKTMTRQIGDSNVTETLTFCSRCVRSGCAFCVKQSIDILTDTEKKAELSLKLNRYEREALGWEGWELGIESGKMRALALKSDFEELDFAKDLLRKDGRMGTPMLPAWQVADKKTVGSVGLSGLSYLKVRQAKMEQELVD